MANRPGSSYRAARGVAAVFVSLVVLAAALPGHAAQRDRLPIVIKAADLPWANIVPIGEIYLYRYNGPSANPKWTPIAFQIDKRRKSYLLHNVYTWAQYQALSTPPPDVCAYTYFPPNPARCATWSAAAGATGVRNCPDTYMADWNDTALKPQDEIVFMARDVVGGQRDECAYEWLDSGGAPGLQDHRLEIQIQDADDVIWVYAYRWSQTPPPGLVNSDPAAASLQVESCAPCPGSPTANAENICGTATGAGHGSDPGYRIHLASNWLIDAYELKHGGVWTDVLDSIGMRAGNEDPSNWSCNFVPRKQGTKSAGPGQVRFIRGIQGAQSGFATVRIDKGYDSAYETEIELRVHDLPSQVLSIDEEHSVDTVPDSSAQEPFSAIWTKTSFSQVTPIQHDRMSTDIVVYPPTSGYTNGPQDWNQIMDSHHGGIAAYSFEDPIRGVLPADDRAHTYVDNATLHGAFGRSWSDISCLQDGISNDGGCGPDGPESLSLLFKRLWYRTIPLTATEERTASDVKADDYEVAAVSPVARAFAAQQLAESGCGGGSPGPCIPVLQVITMSDGTDQIANTPSGSPSGCAPGSVVGYGITRQVAGGLEAQIAIVGIGVAFRDMRTRVGVAHTYRSFSIGIDGNRSAKASPVTVTPLDTELPPTPTITVTPLDQGAAVRFVACGNLVNAANIYVSTSIGGPYSKVNASPVYTSGTVQFNIAGLQNGNTYYVVAKVVDVHGNSSAYSAEVAVSPLP